MVYSKKNLNQRLPAQDLQRWTVNNGLGDIFTLIATRTRIRIVGTLQLEIRVSFLEIERN